MGLNFDMFKQTVKVDLISFYMSLTENMFTLFFNNCETWKVVCLCIVCGHALNCYLDINVGFSPGAVAQLVVVGSRYRKPEV